QKKTDIFSRAFGKPANIVVDAGSSFVRSSYSWRNLAQGGEEDGRMLSSCLPQLSKLKPEYIRIDHVLDFYNVVGRDNTGNIVFNWQKLDQTLNDILSVGAKPFISISYMPPAISSGGVLDLPKDWREWEFVVRQLVEHISGRKGLAISDVYYEVWNEPDLFGKFRLNRSKNYLDLYYHTHKGVLEAKDVLPFRIGGPATTAHFKDWLSGLLDFVSKNSLRFDFYSYHTYSFDISQFESDYLEARRILYNYPPFQNIEILITEFGITGENDRRYDTVFSAIHNLAVVASVEGMAQRIFTFEIKDGIGPEKYWGRWGLLTNEKWGTPEEKPRFKSLEFLNKMKGNRVNIAGVGSWVKGFASEENGVIRLLLVNYDSSAKHYESVPVNFINLPFRNFKYSREEFLGSKTQREIKIDSNSWQTIESLNPNSAVILELSPL
ncbi:MAG: GH39 family glycosyl hydrolase, partial [Microgenomates group bacterium]